MTADARLRAGWRALGLFWAALLMLVGGLAVALQVLGTARPPLAASIPAPEIAAAAPAPAPEPQARPDRITAPLPALLEPSKAFPPAMLPRIAADGRTARTVYARAFDQADKRPRIALLVTGFGMSDADGRAAIDALPGPISLVFSPYGARPESLIEYCRQSGHEFLLSIPMEPQGYPLNDAGSRSLLTGATPAANATNLEWALGRLQGYVGATGAMEGMRGERFADQTSSFEPVLQELGKRGLLYVDPRAGRASARVASIPGRVIDAVVDDPPGRAEIEAKLAALERTARDKGSALGLAGPLRPLTIERIAAWARGLDDKGIALAPVSAVIQGAGR